MKPRKWIYRCLISVWLLFLALIFLIACPVHSEGELVDSDDIFLSSLSAFRSQVINKIVIKCEQQYFNVLSQNNFFEVSIIAMKAGLSDYNLLYSTDGTLWFNDIRWTEPHIVECPSELAFRKIIQNFIDDGIPAFQIIIRDKALFDFLIDDEHIYTYTSMCGIEDVRIQTSGTGPFIIWLDEIQSFSVPWYIVSTEDEWIQGIEFMAARNASHFWLILESSFANVMKNNESLRLQLEARSSISDRQLFYSSDFCRFEFSDVSFSHEPRIFCETTDAIVETIRQMGASGLPSFDLVLPEELFNTLSCNDFSGLQILEADAGMSERNLSYNSRLCLLLYSDAVIQSDAVKLASVIDVNARLAKAAANLENSIVLFCTPELFTLMNGDISGDNKTEKAIPPINDALMHAGISHYYYSSSPISCLIRITVESYYPGIRILKAIDENDDSFLTSREKETMYVAQSLSSLCRRSSPLETARLIHDTLCEKVVYIDDENTDEDDTAIGALLNGQANCDGYADAFFLLGMLANLNVRYQHGNSRYKETGNSPQNATHLWNLLEIDGTWRLVDVTWDDMETHSVYIWFNIGMDRAHLMHKWNEEVSVPLLPQTILSERPTNEYSVQDITDVNYAVTKALNDSISFFTLVFPAEMTINEKEILNVLENLISQSFSYTWNEYMMAMNIYINSI